MDPEPWMNSQTEVLWAVDPSYIGTSSGPVNVFVSFTVA